jgi:hypothetical protein
MRADGTDGLWDRFDDRMVVKPSGTFGVHRVSARRSESTGVTETPHKAGRSPSEVCPTKKRRYASETRGRHAVEVGATPGRRGAWPGHGVDERHDHESFDVPFSLRRRRISEPARF